MEVRAVFLFFIYLFQVRLDQVIVGTRLHYRLRAQQIQASPQGLQGISKTILSHCIILVSKEKSRRHDFQSRFRIGFISLKQKLNTISQYDAVFYFVNVIKYLFCIVDANVLAFLNGCLYKLSCQKMRINPPTRVFKDILFVLSNVKYNLSGKVLNKDDYFYHLKG